MRSVAQLDPASLSVQFDWNFVVSSLDKDDARPLHDAILASDTPSISQAVVGLDRGSRACGGFLASAFWHEQRHFLDFALTCWGALRVRNFFHSYIHFPELLHTLRESGLPLLLPLDTYLDPVERQSLGVVQAPPQNLRIIAGFVKDRREMLEDVQAARHALVSSGLNVHQHLFGAEAQLEALASIAQSASAQYWLGQRLATEANAHIRNVTGAPLIAIELVSFLHSRGLADVVEQPDGSVALRGALPSAIILASLCCRRNPERPPADPTEDAAYWPLLRFILITGELERHGKKLQSSSAPSAWEAVDAACKHLWGRRVVDELKHDIAWEDSIVAKMSAPDFPGDHDVHAAYTDFRNLRSRLFERFATDPLQFVDPESYATSLAPDLRPKVMTCAPSGELWLDERVRPIHYDGNQIGSAFWWSAVRPGTPRDGQLGLHDEANWQKIMGYYAPIARLLTAGRNHKSLINQVELQVGENILRSEGLTLRYDDRFRQVKEPRSPRSDLRILDKRAIYCHICNDTLSPKEAVRNTRWDRDACGAPRLQKYRRDWSDWLVHQSCWEQVQAN